MKRVLLPVSRVLAGIVLSAGLGVGAYAIAGRSLSEPARPLRIEKDLSPGEQIVPTPKSSPSRKASAKPDAGTSSGEDGGSEDNSGSGSSNSGSGSSNSGSGSSNSGSGSGDDEPDDD